MTVDLPVPDEARSAARELYRAGQEDTITWPEDHVRAIAASVVAAELLRFADEITKPRGSGLLDAFTKCGPYNPDVAAIAAHLRARAGELGGGNDMTKTEGET